MVYGLWVCIAWPRRSSIAKPKPTTEIHIPTRIPEKIVVGLFSGILVNSGIPVEADRLLTL